MRGGDLASFYSLAEWLPVANAYFSMAFADPSFLRKLFFQNPSNATEDFFDTFIIVVPFKITNASLPYFVHPKS